MTSPAPHDAPSAPRLAPGASYPSHLAARAKALATRCVHAGGGGGAALEHPVVLSSAFRFPSSDEAAAAFRGESDAWIYGRWGNPGVAALEAQIAALEGAEDACATSSGMAAIAAVALSTCGSGDHLVLPRSMYAESSRLFRERLARFGIDATLVDGTPASYAAAATPRTRLFWTESPSNPLLGVPDLRGIVAAARERSAGRPPAEAVTVACDSTFATPFCQTPLEDGVDLVVHSATKGLSGHGDVVAGFVVGDRARVARARDLGVKGLGAPLAPLSALLVSRGMRTLAVRMAAACRTAAVLAEALARHPAVARVHHPSLPSHPDHALACARLHAFGAVLSFELAGGVAAGRRFVDALRLATHAVSLGDVRTLVVHPASTTHSTMPPDLRAAAGVGDGLVRVSVGLESEDDLLADFVSALSGVD